MRRVEAILWTFIVAFLALTMPAWSQEKEPAEKTSTQEQAPSGKAEKAERVIKVIQLKYANADRIGDLLSIFGGSLKWDRQTKVLTVVGPPATVAALEEAIKKLDVPPPPVKDIDLTAYFVLATRQPMQAGDLPLELDEVVAQLKGVLNYKSFQLLNTAFIRAQDGGGAGVSGVATIGSDAVNFRLNFRSADITLEGKVRTVRIRNLSFEAEHSPNATALVAKTTSAGIHTDIDIVEGQKVVVGRTALGFPDNALILVLTAKVID